MKSCPVYTVFSISLFFLDVLNYNSVHVVSSGCGIWKYICVLRIIFTNLVLWSKLCIDWSEKRKRVYLNGKHQNIDLKEDILVILEA